MSNCFNLILHQESGSCDFLQLLTQGCNSIGLVLTAAHPLPDHIEKLL